MNEMIKWRYRKIVEDMAAVMTRIGYIVHPADDAERADIASDLLQSHPTPCN